MKLDPINLIGGFYQDDNLPWSAQDTVNWIPRPAEMPGTISQMKLAGAPGLELLVQIDDEPVRIGGFRNVEGRMFIVAGTTLYELNTDLTTTVRGTIPGAGPVTMAHNQLEFGNELSIGNGSGSLYVWNTWTSTFTVVSDDAATGSIQSVYLNRRIIHLDPFGRFGYPSDIDSATSYDSLDRFDSEASPDKFVGLGVSQFELVGISQRTTEFYSDTGATEQPFRPKRIAINRGCAARNSIVQLGGTLAMLGDDGIFYRLQGYQWEPISTGPVNKAISGNNWANCFGFVYEDRKHEIAYWTFPDGQTWGYDAWTGLIHRRESFGLNRWRINAIEKWNGMWIAGDFQSGRIYRIDWDTYHENGQPLVAMRTAPPIYNNGNEVVCPMIDLVFDTGCGVAPPIQLSGNLPNGTYLDSGTYQYVASGGIGPLTFSIVSGALPTGATLNPVTGLVTYTYTSTGVFNWTVRASDGFGQYADLPDSATVTAVFAGLWALMSSADSTNMWLSEDPSDWSAPALTRTVPALCQPWAAYGDGALVLPVVASENVNRAANQTPTTTVVTTNVDTDSVGNRVWFEGGLMFKGHETDTDNAYAISQDGGATWTEYPSPVAGNLVGIGRYSSGRWVAHFNRLSVQQAWYSDEAVPVNWTFGFSFPGTVAWDLCCDGVTAIVIGTLIAHRSTNGITWTTSPYPIAPNTSAFMMFSGELGVFIGYSDADNKLCRSTDSGVTWTQTTLPSPPGGPRALAFADYHNGLWALTFTFQLSSPGLAFTSTDNCATLTPVTLPGLITGATTPVIKFLGET